MGIRGIFLAAISNFVSVMNCTSEKLVEQRNVLTVFHLL